MIGKHDTLEADAGGDGEGAEAVCVAPAGGGLLCLVTVNVDGLGEYDVSPSERMGAILKEVLAASPDVLLFQEVVDEMRDDAAAPAAMQDISPSRLPRGVLQRHGRAERSRVRG